MIQPETRKFGRPPALLGGSAAFLSLMFDLGRLKEAVRRLTWWQSVALIVSGAMAYILGAAWFGGRALVAGRGWSMGGVPTLDVPSPGNLEGLLARWDSGFYLQIAIRGYAPDGWERAFFPLYPMLVHAVSWLGLSVLWSGLVVSALAFMGAGLLLYKWLRCDYSHEVALLAVAVLAFLPFSFFFLAFYAESLFLMLSLAGAYFARRGWFIPSGLAIGLAGAARPQAFLLVIPLLAEFWRYRREWRAKLPSSLVALGLVPVGSGVFTLWLATQTANAAGSVPFLNNVQGVWKTTITWPWVTFWDGATAAIMGTDIGNDWFSHALAWHDLLFAIGTVALAVWAVSRMSLGPNAYMVVGLLFVLTVHGPYGYALWSVTRRLVMLFPIYLALALLVRRVAWPVRLALLGVSAGWLGVLAAWFASGRWVA